MCLNIIKDQEDEKEWLRKKSDTIIAYKVVKKSARGSYSPIWQNKSEKFQRTNKIDVDEYRPVATARIGNLSEKGSYHPYYHLFRYKKDARSYCDPPCKEVILKCEVSKKDIATVGWQEIPLREALCIVTRKFKIIEEIE